MSKQKIVILVVVLVVIIAAVLFLGGNRDMQAIASFEECVAAGNPVMESFPRQCRTEDGVLFVEEVAEESQGETVSVEGEISSIDLEAAAVDGPIVITLATQEGGSAVINVPTMGINLCAASSSIASAFDLEVGDVLEVSGAARADGAIVPCESEAHYLRVVAE